MTPSIGTMIARCHGLAGTKDVSKWESEFIESIWKQSNGGTHTSRLSERQVERVEELFTKHFAA